MIGTRRFSDMAIHAASGAQLIDAPAIAGQNDGVAANLLPLPIKDIHDLLLWLLQA